MKRKFADISKEDFKLSLGNITFEGCTSRKNRDFVTCKGKIYGDIKHLCDRCGDEFDLQVNEDVEVLTTDKMAKPSEDDLENIVEFLDGIVDFEAILVSELEAYKSDYFYCKKC